MYSTAVAPVDAVAQRVVGTSRIAGNHVQHVGRAFVGRSIAAQRDDRGHIADAQRLAAQREAAVFVGGADDDGPRRAAVVTIGVGVREAACRRRPFGRGEAVSHAIAPGDAVLVAGVGTRVSDDTYRQRVDAAFNHRVGTTDRSQRGDVVDKHGAGACIGPNTIFVGYRNVDAERRIAIRINVADLAIGREISRKNNFHRAAIAPVDRIFGDRIGARI